MALTSQEISIIFTEGVDTKTDDKIATKLSVLENAYIGQKGTIQKKNGYEALTNTLFTNGEQLLTNKNALAVLAPTQFAVRNDTLASGWRADYSLYTASNINTTYTDINTPFDNGNPRGMQYVSGPDDNIIAFNSATEETPTSQVLTFGFLRRNRSDGSIIRTPGDDRSSSNEFNGGCLVELNDRVYWIIKEAGGIGALEVTTFTNPYPSINLTSSISTTNYMHAFVENGLIFVIYVNNSGKLVVNSYDDALTLQNSFTHTTEVSPIFGGYSIAWNPTRSLYGVFYITDNGSNAQNSQIYLTSALVLSGSIVRNLHGATTTKYLKTTSIYNPAVTEIFVAYDNNDDGVILCTSTPTTLSENRIFIRSQLCSQAFILNSVPHVAIDKLIATSDASIPGFSFKQIYRSLLVDYRGFYCAQLTYDHLSNPAYCLGQINGSVLPLSTGQNGFVLVNIQTSNFQNSSPKELMGNSYVFNSGGQMFDGATFSESSFIAPPYGYDISAGASAGLAAGTYQYALILKTIDFSGNVFYSAPFIDESIKITTASPKTITFQVKPSMPSKRVLGVSVEVYRNSLSDTVFKKVGAILIQDFTLPIAYSFTDELANNSANETLYTTGGILENDPPPVSNIFCTHQDRIFCVNEENPNQVYFSKLCTPGVGVGFSAFLYFNVENSPNGPYERIMGLGSLDDKLIILKSNSLHAVFGDGPNNLGVGSFSTPKLISSDTGCIDPRSIVSTSDGLFFKSPKGIYLLSRSMEVIYIGADVEAFNDQEITSAVLLPTLNQVRFTTRNAVELNYSYFYKQWAYSTGLEAQHAITWKGKFTHLKSSGSACAESQSYLDGVTPITQRIATGWIKLAGIENFQRIYRFQFIGTWKSEHKVRAKIYYDYEDYAWDEVVITPLATGYNTTTKPDMIDIYTGANNGVYEYEIQLSRQKCMAVKIELNDFDHTGESFSLTGMSMIVGLKKGLNKLTSNKKF